MNHFKFEWNQDSASISFNGDMKGFGSHLASYLITAYKSTEPQDNYEARAIVSALSTVVKMFQNEVRKDL